MYFLNMNMLVLKKYPDNVVKIVNEVFPSNWVINYADEEDLELYIREAEVIIPSHTAINEKLLQKADSLKIIQTGAGYDNVDTDLCRKKGIKVYNAPSVNTNEVAEHTFAFIFRWFKKIEDLNNDIRNNGWSDQKEAKAFSDLTIGIIGWGNIGKKVARTADVFGMKIIVKSSYKKPGVNGNIYFTDKLEELLPESDIITVHTSAGTDKNKMFSDSEFALMKKESFFINTARGSLVDEDALCRALDKKLIAGAALDVFNTEPLPLNSRLRNYDNILMTPHNAGEPDLYNSYKKRFSFFYTNILKADGNRKAEGEIV